jgi:class 3 adenylate cyclase/tetratricopeptide (TPR) repeat protein
MSTLIQTLAPYIPPLLAQHHATDPAPPSAPWEQRFRAAILFTDMSGFTPLTQRLAERGPVGAEQLSGVLNDYFAKLLDILTAHGGQVIGFAGDATIVAWPGMDTDEDLPALTLRAAQCGLELMSSLNGYAVAQDIVLSLKAGIGAGEVWAATVGGVRNRWHFVVGGDPLEQMAAAERQAKRGEVVLSPAAWALVRERCTGRPHPTGYLHLLGVRDPLPPRALEPVHLPPEAAAALRAYVPPTAMERIDAGQMEWLASLRRVTTLFMNVSGLDYTASDALARVQAATCAIQEVVDSHNGSLNQLIVDDKGTTVVAAWGLPGYTHEDDGLRAVRAGLALLARLRDLGLGGAVGISTGRAFCGHRGSERRREYAVIGDKANLAARLMMAAADDALLCDEATYQSTQTWLAFHPMPPLILQGHEAPQPAFRVRGERQESSKPRELSVVDRRAERAMLGERLRALQNPVEDGGEVRVVVIEGEPGIGKSCLVGDLLRQAEALGVRTLVGEGDSVEQTTAYFAWRPVFSRLFGLDRTATAQDENRELILAQLEPEPDLKRVAPLLNAVLSLNLPDNDLTAEMSGEVRADNTIDLLVRLLAALTSPAEGQGGTLIVLEDAQWLDSASWALARRVSRDVAAALLVVVTRPLGESPPEDYVKLVRESRTVTVRLDPLSREDVVELLRERLGASHVAHEVVAFVHGRSEGNPFFAEELAYALRDADLVAIEDDTCHFVVDIDELSTLLPDTIEGVITARIDQLPAQHQMTLKVASVIGRLFAFRTLRDVHPIEADRDHLIEHVNHLDQLDITPLQTPEPDLAYIFKHIITQEVAYNLLLFSQRSQLHRAVAEWYEQAHAAGGSTELAEALSAYYSLLAYHWERAIGGEGSGPDAASKALDYLEKAGDQALHNFANDEAVTFFERALALAATTGAEVGKLRQAHWELQLGATHTSLGQYIHAREHLEAGLVLLGQPVPGTMAHLVPSLLGQVLRQVSHRAWPGHFVGRLLDRKEILLPAFRAYEKLAEVYFFAGETVTSMHAAFRALNIAEAAGPSPDLARGYASMGALVGFIPLHGAAEAYLRRALDGAQASANLATREFVAMAAGFYYAGVGNWEKARGLFDQILDISQRLGDRRLWVSAMSNLAPIHYYRGEFTSGAGLAAALYAVGHDQHSQAQGLQWQAKGLFALGKFDEVAACLSELQIALGEDSKIVDEAMKLGVQGLRAATHLRQGAYQSALEAAKQTMDMAAKTMPSSYGVLSGYANPAEVFLALWEVGHPEPNLDTMTRKACKLARGFARVFPIGRPRALLWGGLYEWLAGKPVRAHKAWLESLAVARSLEMAYDEALAHYEIGRHTDAGDPARQEHLSRAGEIFERLGAAYDLGRVQKVIGSS